MTYELDKIYDPASNEDKIYKRWEESGLFNPDNLSLSKDSPSYTIVLPPPNITDKLHMGHAATLAIEDLLIRYHRLRGFRTLWLPGTDHAAIATQNVVEKKILKESGKTRQDLGREKFLEEVWKFLRVTQGEILHQSRKMGASLDWSRLAFTLDEPRQLAVRTMFKEMYDEGVIYRGERVVNWCPRCHSTLADDEVEYKEKVGKLYTFKYDHDFPLPISTTRPETKLGDVAVAVNPKDRRYHEYIGKDFKVDFCGQTLQIKIIADHNVDPEFGTGALGVTPAHSAVDAQMAINNNLPVIKVIDEDGKISGGFGAYSGLDVDSAREKIVLELRARGLLISEEEINNNLSVCYRCGTPIEPLPSRQWFISVDKKIPRLGNKSLKEKAMAVALDGQIKFLPDRFTKRYLDWMDNLHDWCISRQIWFGHQIPVWYRGEEIYVGLDAPDGNDWQQDPDTLDTWFSSGMWTFSTLGWPVNYQKGQKIGDLAQFHPTQVLETGYEIITLWVSRMIMMSLFALNEIPFSQVYLHGMILDQNGKKMSKSKGNGINPLDMIAKFGTDATRLAVLTGSTPGNDSRFSEDKVEAKRNFINKLWNISRFILATTGEKFLATRAEYRPAPKTAADSWIIGELDSLITRISSHLDNLNFSLAAEDLHDFTWNKLADWYLEIAKFERNKEEVLVYLLKNVLKLWHPFIPFVTENIWQSFNDSLLMVEKWPQGTGVSDNNQKIVKDAQIISLTISLIQKIRDARAKHKIEPTRKISAVIYAHSLADELVGQDILFKNLRTGIDGLRIIKEGEKIKDAIYILDGEVEVYLIGAIDAGQEKRRLAKEQANLEKLIAGQSQKISNPDFTDRAPAHIVDIEKNKLSVYQAELDKILKIMGTL